MSGSDLERHDPRRAAMEAAEAVRQLNHDIGRIETAADAYEIVGALAACLERMPQALSGIEGWLIRMDRGGRLRRTGGGRVDERLCLMRQAFGLAGHHMDAAGSELRRTHALLSDVYGPVPEEGAER